MSNSIYLKDKIRKYFLILSTSLIIIYSIFITLSYIIGSDHAFGLVLQNYAKGGESHNHSEKQKNLQSYSDARFIPEELLSVFPINSHVPNQLQFKIDKNKSIYFLPHVSSDKKTKKYVFYVFSDDINIITSLLVSLLILASLLIILVIVVARKWIDRVMNPVVRLSKWAGELDMSSDNVNNYNVRGDEFEEFRIIAFSLNESIRSIAKKNQREKILLRNISHELRTPIAVTQGALDILDKKDDGSLDPWRKTISRIRKSNNDTIALIETLLWIWKSNEIDIRKELFSPDDELKEIIKCNRYLIIRDDVSINIESANSVKITSEKVMWKIVVNNLVRNAFQYSSSGNIKISLNSRSIKIENPIEYYGGKNISGDFGTGVGLLLVEQLIERTDWDLDIVNGQSAISAEFRYN